MPLKLGKKIVGDSLSCYFLRKVENRRPASNFFINASNHSSHLLKNNGCASSIVLLYIWSKKNEYTHIFVGFFKPFRNTDKKHEERLTYSSTRCRYWYVYQLSIQRRVCWMNTNDLIFWSNSFKRIVRTLKKSSENNMILVILALIQNTPSIALFCLLEMCSWKFVETSMFL